MNPIPTFPKAITSPATFAKSFIRKPSTRGGRFGPRQPLARGLKKIPNPDRRAVKYY